MQQSNGYCARLPIKQSLVQTLARVIALYSWTRHFTLVLEHEINIYNQARRNQNLFVEIGKDSVVDEYKIRV